MMQAHRTSGVVIDIATFKVSHAVGVDIHATALQAKKKERITFHRGQGLGTGRSRPSKRCVPYSGRKATPTRARHPYPYPYPEPNQEDEDPLLSPAVSADGFTFGLPPAAAPTKAMHYFGP